MAEFKIEFMPDTSDVSMSFDDDSGFTVDGFGSVTTVVDRDYEKLVNKPAINSVEVVGDKTGDEYNLQNKLTAGENISLNGTVISAEFEQEFATYSEVMAILQR